MIQTLRRRIAVLSLGCSKNLVDSEALLGILKKENYVLSERVSNADVAVVNTCGFIEESKQESVDHILALAELKRQGHLQALVVMGCLAQKHHRDLAAQIPEIDLLLGSADYPKLPALLDGLLKPHSTVTAVEPPHYLHDPSVPRVAITPRHFRYLKIAEGCNHPCAFCIIPALRGPHRSRTIPSLLEEARQLLADGARELNVISQDTTFFGIDRSGRQELADLLYRLNELPGKFWIRLFYVYPALLNEEVLTAVRDCSKVCKYVDMPIQHISTEVLRRMRRGMTREKTEELLQRIREAIPGVAIRTTFIVGFPGETEREFEELLGAVERFRFERLGVFRYSREPDTRAGVMPDQVDARVKERRFRQIMELQQRISADLNRSQVGRSLEVLIDEAASERQDLYMGRSYQDAPEVDGLIFVRANGRRLAAGEFATVRVSGSLEYDLIGDRVDASCS